MTQHGALTIINASGWVVNLQITQHDMSPAVKTNIFMQKNWYNLVRRLLQNLDWNVRGTFFKGNISIILYFAQSNGVRCESYIIHQLLIPLGPWRRHLEATYDSFKLTCKRRTSHCNLCSNTLHITQWLPFLTQQNYYNLSPNIYENKHSDLFIYDQ